MGIDRITVRGARQHNLKNINVDIPRDKFTVITGLSGSGKSSLAFDTIYAEGQRRYVESLSAYARQFLDQLEKPDVDSVDGLSPAGRLARLEMAVHLSRPRHRERQSTDHPGRHAGQLRADLLGRDEQLLRAAARQPDLHHGGNGDAPSPAGRPSWNIPGAVGPVQRRWFRRYALYRRGCASRRLCAVGGRRRAAPVRCSTRKPMPIWPSRAARLRLSPIVPSLPTCSTAS